MRWASGLQERYPPNPDDPRRAAGQLRSGEPEFFPSIPAELLDEAIGDDLELRRIIDELRPALLDLRAVDVAAARSGR